MDRLLSARSHGTKRSVAPLGPAEFGRHGSSVWPLVLPVVPGHVGQQVCCLCNCRGQHMWDGLSRVAKIDPT
jgi:hypothetical protein